MNEAVVWLIGIAAAIVIGLLAYIKWDDKY